MIDLVPGGIHPRRTARVPASATLPPPRRRAPGVLVLLGFVATAAGGVWLWQQQQEIALRGAPAVAAAPDGRLEALARRVAELAQRPAPPPDPAPALRLGALEHRVAALERRLTQLEQRPPPPPLAEPGAGQAGESTSHTVDQRLSPGEPPATATPRLQAARAALETGRPLGDIPNAPPALARFAHAGPPTERSLRLSFPAAADAAALAGDPSTAGLTSLQRMWQRVQTLVTVQLGNQIVIGLPASRTLALAQARLDAGDLAGAVTALDALDPAAAGAVADWRAEAQALLDARAALAALAPS